MQLHLEDGVHTATAANGETTVLPVLTAPAPDAPVKLSSKLSEPPNENWLVSIGNSDNKLTQAAWAEFIHATQVVLDSFAVRWHGRWYSSPTDPWQNANFCFQLPEMPSLGAYMAHAHDLEVQLGRLAAAYAQDSIAVTRGPVRFIPAASGVVTTVAIVPGRQYGTDDEYWAQRGPRT